MAFLDNIKHAWNAFLYKDSPGATRDHMYMGSASPSPMHRTPSVGKSKFTSSVFNRIALDVAVTEFKHIKMDPNTRLRTDIDNGINTCLTYEANKDQNYMQFIQDVVYSMFEEGYIAVVPIDTEDNPKFKDALKINSLRVGKIVRWYPDHVEVQAYDDRRGRMDNIIVEKRRTAILENPLYAVINGPNITLQRLLSKMALVDNMDNITGSGRLDILIQLPYAASTVARRSAVDERIAQIEEDLKKGTNGVAYIQHNESVIQLNRPANSQILEQADKLKEEFYNQLGITANIMNGTASEAELRSYYTRSIDPIINTITSEFNRKFLTKTAYTQGHRTVAYRNNFQFVGTQQIAELSDKLKRNTIATTNEIRELIGMEPIEDEEANKLVNPNLPAKDQPGQPPGGKPDTSEFVSAEEEYAERASLDEEDEDEE